MSGPQSRRQGSGIVENSLRSSKKPKDTDHLDKHCPRHANSSFDIFSRKQRCLRHLPQRILSARTREHIYFLLQKLWCITLEIIRLLIKKKKPGLRVKAGLQGNVQFLVQLRNNRKYIHAGRWRSDACALDQYKYRYAFKLALNALTHVLLDLVHPLLCSETNNINTLERIWWLTEQMIDHQNMPYIPKYIFGLEVFRNYDSPTNNNNNNKKKKIKRDDMLLKSQYLYCKIFTRN